jgi:hypothetical protein
MKRDEVYQQKLDPGRKLACVRYSDKILDEDAQKIKREVV